MKFSDKLAGQFDAGVRARGLAYFKQKKVKLESIDHESIKTLVKGTQTYRVEFWLDSKTQSTDAFCTCPHFSGGQLCKHLWATLLLADEVNWEALQAEKKVPEEKDPLDLMAHEPWMDVLQKLKSQVVKRGNDGKVSLMAHYVFYYFNGLDHNSTCIEVKVSDRKQNGDWGKAKPKSITHRNLLKFSGEDQSILRSLLGVEQEEEDQFYPRTVQANCSSFSIDDMVDHSLIKRICRSGRASFRAFDGLEIPKLLWDDLEEWNFELNFQEKKECFEIEGFFQSKSRELNLSEIHLVLKHGLMFWENKVSEVKLNGLYDWFQVLQREERIVVPQVGKSKLQELIYSMPQSVDLKIPENLMMETKEVHLHKKIVLYKNVYERSVNPSLLADISFTYAAQEVVPRDGTERVILPKDNKVIQRDLEQEELSLELLAQLGFKTPPSQLGVEAQYLITTSKFRKAMTELMRNNWELEAEGNKYELVESTQLQVSSGIDWFELHGELTYKNSTTNLADVFEALKKGSEYVKLGDGHFGILPLKWLQDVAPMIKMGDVHDEHLVFKKNQTALLDTLLASTPNIDIDQRYREYRHKLLKLDDIKAIAAPDSFVGELRDYQGEGLSWLKFLNELGLGGCLADDMGLGKTVQVLALLSLLAETSKEGLKPCLIVVPKSLLFNWKEEVGKFTPHLKVLEYSGSGREQVLNQDLMGHLVLTTYGMMRQDILKLKSMAFHYVILDEAQAIKNPNSQVAKASRLLQADHRLILSGTPIENDLNDIWSLFEFLNPGMLGKFKAFGKMKENDSREFLKKALRPFILRRTKAEVAKGLPDKTEQTIYCEMSKDQQDYYDDLKNFYQAGLMKKIQSDGMGKVKIQVLEALLRLRQAACHPALVSAEQGYCGSAKLEVLFEQLQEIMAGGHKALVFSQFTSLLTLFREVLDQHHIDYAYLDGRTRNREACVSRFQNDDACQLFLISLKAGGVGLNLTAAEYVFILDPWWNPAVEAQAVDRAHRIGQNKHVFAYRLITKGTVEEKILKLQEDKKDLAESIISKDNSVIKKLTPEELDFLLS